MRPDLIASVVKNPDPDFVRILERLPDPAPDAYEKVMQSLSELHEIFLRKRQAATANDATAFDSAVDLEVELLRRLRRKEKPG